MSSGLPIDDPEFRWIELPYRFEWESVTRDRSDALISSNRYVAYADADRAGYPGYFLTPTAQGRMGGIALLTNASLLGVKNPMIWWVRKIMLEFLRQPVAQRLQAMGGSTVVLNAIEPDLPFAERWVTVMTRSSVAFAAEFLRGVLSERELVITGDVGWEDPTVDAIAKGTDRR